MSSQNNNMEFIRSKRGLVKLIKNQFKSVYITDDLVKDLKKNKLVQEQALWIDSFVEENFKYIPVVKNKFSTTTTVGIIRKIIKKIFLYAVTLLFMHQLMSASYFRVRPDAPSTILRVFNFSPFLFLGIFLYMYLDSYDVFGNVEKEFRRMSKVPIIKYRRFLIEIGNRIELMSEKEISEMLKKQHNKSVES